MCSNPVQQWSVTASVLIAGLRGFGGPGAPGGPGETPTLQSGGFEIG